MLAEMMIDYIVDMVSAWAHFRSTSDLQSTRIVLKDSAMIGWFSGHNLNAMILGFFQQFYETDNFSERITESDVLAFCIVDKAVNV